MMGFSGLELTSAIGKPVPLDADGARLLRSNARRLAGELHVARRAEGHGVREAGDIVEAIAQPALEVGADDQGKLGILLQPIDQRGRFQRLILVEHAVFKVDGQPESPECGTGAWRRAARGIRGCRH